MITEAHLKGQEFSLLITLFYIGYLVRIFSQCPPLSLEIDTSLQSQVAQYPTNYLMQRFPTGKYLTVNFVLWG